MYTGDHMNWKKKTEYITFRATEEVKEALRAEAEEHKWSISQLVEQIVSEWLEQKEKHDPKGETLFGSFSRIPGEA